MKRVLVAIPVIAVLALCAQSATYTPSQPNARTAYHSSAFTAGDALLDNVDATDGGFSVTLPDCSLSSTQRLLPITIKKSDFSFNPVTIYPSGSQLVGSFQIRELAVQGAWIQIACGNCVSSGDSNWCLSGKGESDFIHRFSLAGMKLRVGGPPYSFVGLNTPTTTSVSGLSNVSGHDFTTATTSALLHAVAGFNAGTSSPQDYWLSHPNLSFLVRTSGTIANQRLWVGAANGTGLAGAGAGGTDCGTGCTVENVAMRYSTAAGDTDWMLCSGDGANGSCVDTGAAVSASATYLLIIDYTAKGQLLGAVFTNGGDLGSVNKTVVKSTNLPTSSNQWGIAASIEALDPANVAASFLIGSNFTPVEF